jgi:hypothetical protein
MFFSFKQTLRPESDDLFIYVSILQDRDPPRGARRTNPGTAPASGRRRRQARSTDEEESAEEGDSPAMMRFFSNLLQDHLTGNGRMPVDMESMNEAFMDQILAQLADQHQPVSYPTASRIISALPTYNVRPRSSKGEPAPSEAFACAGEPCPVCHEEFVEKSKVAELCCSHCFHGDCIKPWLETHNTCPVCRIELETEED